MKLQGIFQPLTTPFGADGSLALDRLRDNVSRYNRTRTAGYVVVGSTGESVLLRDNEIELVFAAVREAAAPEKILIAGTGVDSTAETIDRTNRAASLGYHAALVKTPYYYKMLMTPEVHAEHYLRVADAAKIPLLIYSVPQFTGVAVEAPLVAKLAQHPNIIGIKESSGNVQRVEEIIGATSADFQTLVGSATTLYPSMVMGAVGGVLALANVLPDLCVELFDAACGNHLERAKNLQHRIIEPTRIIVAKIGIPGIKYAMDRVGYFGGPPRLPLLPLNDAQKKEVENVLATVTTGSAVTA